MTPVVCPVCNGRQMVEEGFYLDVQREQGPQKCRSCGGAGVIWTHGHPSPPVVPQPLPQTPYPFPPNWYYEPYLTWYQTGPSEQPFPVLACPPEDVVRVCDYLEERTP